MACITIVRQFRLIDLWPCTCHTKPGRVKEESVSCTWGGRGGLGLLCTQHSTHVRHYLYNEQRKGRGKWKLSYKLAFAQLLQVLVLAITNLAYKILLFRILKHYWDRKIHLFLLKICLRYGNIYLFLRGYTNMQVLTQNNHWSRKYWTCTLA